MRNTVEAPVIEHDLATGSEKTIVHQGIDGGLSLSPDGQYLAMTKSNPDAKSSVLVLVSTRGGDSIELARLDSSQQITVQAWTPDSRAVLVRKSSPSDPSGELWKISLDGGQSIKLELNVHFQGSFSVHPDGRQIAYAVTEPAKEDEVWVLENFLPALNAKK